MNHKIFIIIIIIVLIISLIFIFFKYQSENIIQKINKLFEKYADKNSVYDPYQYEWTQQMRNNWKNILREYDNYVTDHQPPLFKELNETVASCDLKNKWRTVHLRDFNIDTKNSTFFPETMKLINQCLPQCTLAYFSLLEPGAKLAPHIGLYKGVIRYHLALRVPNDWENCFLVVDKKKLNWHEGHDIMFDDMFLHYVENNTNESRLVLFLDIKRNFNNIILDKLNDIIISYVKTNDVLNETVSRINNFSDAKIKLANEYYDPL